MKLHAVVDRARALKSRMWGREGGSGEEQESRGKE
jgi:hypothetical protein